MKKITEILFAIGMCLVLPAGIFGVIYELFIWNKSIIPDWLFNMVIIIGTIGFLCIIPFIFCVLYIFLQWKVPLSVHN